MYGLPSVVSNSCSGFFRTSKISRTGKNLSNPQVFDRKQGAAAGPAIQTVAAQACQTRPDQAISAVGHDRRALTTSGGICNKQCDKRISPYGIVFFSAGRIFFCDCSGKYAAHPSLQTRSTNKNARWRRCAPTHAPARQPRVIRCTLIICVSRTVG